MSHSDDGKFGSKFTFVHQPLKSKPAFFLLFLTTSVTAFSFGLHLMDIEILSVGCLILVLCLILRLHRKIYSESILILPSLGLQVETVYYLGSVKTHFIHISYIKDIVINEAVTMHSILCYLVVLLYDPGTGQTKGLYPLFSHSWPPLSDLKSVYKAAQQNLIKPNKR
ncbi:phosphatidylinositol n-acetylglucosaminyltransferase subunit h-like [Plakobranchus ocellatus]|uniref:Phosphatidylinositol n-acetylglucosaminyltransferase subunit h-like n=1 Tax=Plakobranchus ocellatus TaxID=259542 RepID=A0AAV4DW08_9GAST|nr:phosphatidylinositol n-acetylglucosaminyltransferase subunit h-like [Plakobranchus ocellatus]